MPLVPSTRRSQTSPSDTELKKRWIWLLNSSHKSCVKHRLRSMRQPVTDPGVHRTAWIGSSTAAMMSPMRVTSRSYARRYPPPGPQRRNFVEKRGQWAGDRVGDLAADAIGLKHGRHCLRSSAPTDLVRRVANHRGAVRHFLQHDRRRADAGAMADPEGTQDLGSRAHDDIVADGGMALLPALLAGRPSAAQRHTVIKGAVVADLGGLADYDTHAVIDEQPAADAGAGMDLDAGQHPPDMRDEAAQEVEAALPQPMRGPEIEEGLETGVTQHDFQPRARRRIAR